MSEFISNGTEPWILYSGEDSSSSQRGVNQEDTQRHFETSMSAISYGLVATAILVFMFLLMAIFEHLFQSNIFSSPQDENDGSTESGSITKCTNSHAVPTSYASDVSVMMPGQQHPTFIAQPAPLPCPRERIYWPSHEQNFVPSIT